MNVFLMAASQQKPISDVTPNAVDWADVSYNAITDSYIINIQQITGVNSPITLQVNISAGNPIIIYRRIDITAPGWSNGGLYNGSAIGFTQVNNGDTFTINNNEYLSFFCEPDGPFDSSRGVTVINTTDNNTTLNIFFASISGFLLAPP